MPVPVQCPQCSKKLNVPDKYRGKAIKCPGCKGGLKIPAAKSKQRSAAAKQARKPQPVAAPESDADFLADLNFGGNAGVQADVRLCPKCTTELDFEDGDVCPECGHNLATGRLDDQVARLRARGGVDPPAFFSEALPDGWAFVKRDFKMATRTTIVWALFGTLAFIFWACLQNSEKGPIVTFFTFLTSLATFAVAGWYWFLSLKVVDVTMQKENRIKRFHVDVFQTLALGLRAVMWPIVTSAPVFVLIGVWWFLTEGDGKPSIDQLPIKIAIGVYVLTYTLFPIAQIHMNARYTYRASVLWELLKAVPANIGQLLFWNVCALILLGPFAAIFGVLEARGGGGNLFRNETLYGWAKKGTEFLDGFVGSGEDGALYALMLQSLAALICLIALLIIAFFASMPAVMLMRITGKFGLYRKKSLNLLTKAHRGDPAGFWVRYVAGTTDMVLVPFAPIIAAREKSITMIGLLLMGLAISSLLGIPAFIGDMWNVLVPAYLVVAMWIYYAVLESGSSRATIGKENMRLVAETSRGGQKSLGDASMHWLFSTLLLVAFPILAFDKQKRSLGDRMAKCRVVWKGDD